MKENHHAEEDGLFKRRKDDLRREEEERLLDGEEAGHEETVSASEAWTPDDWHDWFDERVAIAEYDGGLEHADAVRRARNSMIDEEQRRASAKPLAPPVEIS